MVVSAAVYGSTRAAEMFAAPTAASSRPSLLPKAGRQSVACASSGPRKPRNRICLPRGSPAARPRQGQRPWTLLRVGLSAPCARPAYSGTAARALVDGLCAGVDLPPFTVCSRVTGTPLPWGPLGPVGLALSAFVVGSTWLDEASTSRDKRNAATGALLLCLAAAPRTQGGAAAVSLLLLGSAFLGSAGVGGEFISGGGDGSSEPTKPNDQRRSNNDGSAAAASFVVSLCAWTLLAAASWLAAGSTAGLPAA